MLTVTSDGEFVDTCRDVIVIDDDADNATVVTRRIVTVKTRVDVKPLTLRLKM